MSPEEALTAALDARCGCGVVAKADISAAQAALTASGYTIVRSDELARLRAVETAARAVMGRYAEQGHCDDSASWARFDALDRALEDRP